MNNLITRIVEDEGADRDLDGDLFQKYGGADWDRAYKRAQEPCGCPHDMAVRRARDFSPHYTSSVDDALAFAERMLPGWQMVREHSDGHFWVRFLSPEYARYEFMGVNNRHRGPSMLADTDIPRAILAATLKALEQEGR